MPKIRGKFAPLFDELGNDPRWIMESTDFEKMIYMLMLYTIYMNNNKAPLNPHYYRVRYGVRARKHLVKHAIDTLLTRFPKFICTDENLSMLNYKGYESRVARLEGLEGEVEGEIEGKGESNNPTHPANVTKSTKDKCLEILKCKIFKNVSESDRQKAFESYPIDFLHDRLKSYAYRPKQIAIRGETFLKWLTEDFEKFKKEQAKQKSAEEESRRSREALKKMQSEAAAAPPPEFYEMKKKLKGGRK